MLLTIKLFVAAPQSQKRRTAAHSTTLRDVCSAVERWWFGNFRLLYSFLTTDYADGTDQKTEMENGKWKRIGRERMQRAQRESRRTNYSYRKAWIGSRR